MNVNSGVKYLNVNSEHSNVKFTSRRVARTIASPSPGLGKQRQFASVPIRRLEDTRAGVPCGGSGNAHSVYHMPCGTGVSPPTLIYPRPACHLFIYSSYPCTTTIMAHAERAAFAEQVREVEEWWKVRILNHICRYSANLSSLSLLDLLASNALIPQSRSSQNEAPLTFNIHPT